MDIKQYDTLRSKDNKTWRVVGIDGSTLEIKKVNDNATDKMQLSPGKPRRINVSQVDGTEYRRLDIPPVTVTHKPTENAMQKQREVVEQYRPKTDKEIIKELKAQQEILKQEIADLKKGWDDKSKTISKMQQRHEAVIADLKDEHMEKEAKSTVRIKSLEKANNDLRAECIRFEGIQDEIDDLYALTHSARTMASALLNLVDVVESKLEVML